MNIWRVILAFFLTNQLTCVLDAQKNLLNETVFKVLTTYVKIGFGYTHSYCEVYTVFKPGYFLSRVIM